MTYCVQDFQGLIPRVDSNSLPGNAALVAQNVDLSHGRIDPWHTPRHTIDLGEGTCAVHQLDCCWKGAESSCAEFYTSTPCDHVYLSDPGDCPRVFKEWCTNDTSIYLGLPVPNAPEVISQTTPPDAECTELRHYVVTAVGPCGEGAPSKPSQPIKADKDTVVQLEIPTEASKYDVTHYKIYVSHDTWDAAQGYVTSDPAAIGSGYLDPLGATVECFCVGTVDAGTGVLSFTDFGGGASVRLGSSLTTEGFLPPPEGLIIFGETNQGSLVGGVGNKIYFSERNAPWAWPRRNCKTLGCDFRYGCVVGDTLIVATDGKPYIIQDDASGEYDGSGSRTVTELDAIHPLVSRKSFVCTNTGAVWATWEGLVRVTSGGAVDMLSTTHYGADDWLQIDPGSIRAAHYRGSYVFTSSRFSGIFDLNLRGHSAPGPQSLTSICLFPKCWINDKQGNLYYLTCEGEVLQWDAGDDYLTYEYTSAISQLPRPTSLSAAVVQYSNLKRSQTQCEPSILTITSDCRDRCHRSVTRNHSFRISLNNVYDLQVSITGQKSIRRICLATDFDTLQTAA